MEDSYDEYQEVALSKRRDSCGSAGKKLRRGSSESSGGADERRTTTEDRPPDSQSCSKERHKIKQKHKRQRDADRRRKRDACEGHVDLGFIAIQEENVDTECWDSTHVGDDSSHHCAEPKSQELEGENGDDDSEDETHLGIRQALQQAAASPKKKKLILANLGITMGDIALTKICDGQLGKSLHKLSLAKNLLESVPAQLVQSLPMLVHLDLSSCRLRQLPPLWNLVQLQILNLSDNLLCDFPDETILLGLPELRKLNLNRNKISAFVIPEDKKVLPKLECLDLGDNGLEQLPDELDQIVSLKFLYLKNNLLKKIPMRICEMNLQVIDIEDNTVLAQPPLECCQSGPMRMRLYWRSLGLEDPSRTAGLDLLGCTPATESTAKHMAFVLPQVWTNPFAVSPTNEGSEQDTSSCVSRDPELDQQARDLFGAVVVVGLWDETSRKIIGVGSGFVVSRRRGLIVTACHTLINNWCDASSEYGEYGKDYFGLPQRKVVIGVIPTKTESDSYRDRGVAVFRYFAKIVAKDPSMEMGGNCHIDACVLRITGRFENDVDGEGEGCGDQLFSPLLGNNQKLHSLELSECSDIDEDVMILGYGQSVEDAMGPNLKINRFVDYIPGRITDASANESQFSRTRFDPRQEIAVICPTVGGHSGGPAVDRKGRVIGIVSRVDPRNKKMCYLSPTSEWKFLVENAKRSET